MSAFTMDDVSHSNGMPDRIRKGTNAAHILRNTGETHLGSFDMAKLCGGILGSSADETIVSGTDVDGTLCKRCDAIYGRIMDAQTAAVAALESDAPAETRELSGDDVRDAVKRSKGANRKARKGAAVDAERERLARQTRVNGERVITVPGADAPTLGRALASEPGRMEFVWAEALGDGADMIAVSALGDVVSGGDHVYVMWSGGAWHAGDSVPLIDSTYYGQGESPDVAVKIVLHKRAVVAEYERADREESGSTLPGDVDASTPGNTDRVTAALNAARERVSRAALDALGADVVASLSLNVQTPRAAADERRDAQSGVAAERPAQARAWARITDGKCAAVVAADALDDVTGLNVDADGNVTVTLSGRMRLDKATAVASLCGGGVMVVGKSSGALAPVAGSLDAVNKGDGRAALGYQTGTCPVCRVMVKLTGSGAIGSHRPDGSTPDAPQLSERQVPAVDTRGEATRDAARKRDGEAYRDDVVVTLDPMAPVAEQVAAVRAAVAGDKKAPGVKPMRVPVVDSGATHGERERRTTGIKGGRNQGRSDGVAMVPLGESGYAGFKFDDGRGSTDENGKPIHADGPMSEVDPIKGGPFGTVRESVYNAMSSAQRRRYRAKVAHNRAVWEAGRDKRKAERAAKGMSRTDMVKARKAASVGSSRQGHTYSHHMTTKDTDVVVTAFGRVPRIGRDVPSDAK